MAEKYSKTFFLRCHISSIRFIQQTFGREHNYYYMLKAICYEKLDVFRVSFSRLLYLHVALISPLTDEGDMNH